KNSNQAFNVEMQACDTKELPERARYYQGVIDVDCLKSGHVKIPPYICRTVLINTFLLLKTVIKY
nr:hypothetical protein [Treponema sp.]